MNLWVHFLKIHSVLFYHKWSKLCWMLQLEIEKNLILSKKIRIVLIILMKVYQIKNNQIKINRNWHKFWTKTNNKIMRKLYIYNWIYYEIYCAHVYRYRCHCYILLNIYFIYKTTNFWIWIESYYFVSIHGKNCNHKRVRIF